MTTYKWKYTYSGKYINKIIIAEKSYRMCVVAKRTTAFELATTYFQVKKESYTELNKKKRWIQEYWTEKKKNRSNVHDNIMCYIIRTKNRSATALNYIISFKNQARPGCSEIGLTLIQN